MGMHKLELFVECDAYFIQLYPLQLKIKNLGRFGLERGFA